MQLKNSFKFFVGLGICFIIRLIPFRPPNFEPLLATQMPFAERFGWLAAFVFGFASIVLFDVVTSGVGMWTWITALMYGTLGIGATFFFKRFGHGTSRYVAFSLIGTLLYDAVTGLSVGPLFFDQPFTEALVGQLPFTAMHLMGNVLLSVTLSPLVYHFVVVNEKLDGVYVTRFLTSLWKGREV